MEDFAYDLPFAIDFEQREHVGVTSAVQVGEFEPYDGDRADKVDAGDPCLELRRRTVPVAPVKELLDGAAKQGGVRRMGRTRFLGPALGAFR